MNPLYNQIKIYLNTLDLNLNNQVIENLILFWDLVMSHNEQINLVSRKTDYSSGIITHIVDSLTLLRFDLPKNIKYLDFGTGAGLPGIPLKLVNRDWDVSLVEPTQKRVNFIKKIIDHFKLDKIRVYDINISPNCNSHPELFNLFDVVTARAVNKLHYLAPRISPLLKTGGKFIAYKGPNFLEDLEQSQKELKKQNLDYIDTILFELPIINAKRALLLFKKV
jgi:16S rRNA (guanine527-N7)-methyltransferase